MTRELWDREAPTFDLEPDHGLADPDVREAWRELLLGLLPAPPARVADLGCGTGTLTRLLADEGYAVTGLDFSPEMIGRARAKVPEATFVIADAQEPPLERGGYDVVLGRHVLWAMRDPVAAVSEWVGLLGPGGILVLVEGRWSTGVGLAARGCEDVVRSVRTEVEVQPLRDRAYWGQEIEDERYVLVSRR